MLFTEPNAPVLVPVRGAFFEDPHMADLPELSSALLADAQDRVAMKTPQHLTQFLQSSDRTFLILHAPTLVRGLPWPQGVEALLQVIDAYTSERRLQDTGFFVDETLPNGEKARVPVPKDDRLHLDEIDEAILQLKRLRVVTLAELKRKGATSE